MENIDYIIVGDGYAGLFFAHQLYRHGKSLRLFSDGVKGASQVSAGIVNPVVLKKFTTFWKAQEQLNFLQSTLEEISRYTGTNYFVNDEIQRIFHDANEKDLWQKKALQEDLQQFLSNDFSFLSTFRNGFGTGKVLQSGRLNVAAFFNGLREFYFKNNFLIQEKFSYELLQPETNTYRDFRYKNIVFCEGMGVRNNPYFSSIPVQPNKGHHLKINMQTETDKDVIVKKKHFLFPLQDKLWYYGGTYDREQVHEQVDPAAVNQLKQGLEEIFSGNFEVSEVQYGFRPTVKDRRPILGSHSEFDNLFVFNGLGARGILNGCYFSAHLFDHIENGTPLHPEVDLNRFL